MSRIKILDFISLGIIALIWTTVVVQYPQLPDEIPTHFDLSGNADRYGSKQSVYALPVTATIVFVILKLAMLALPVFLRHRHNTEDVLTLQKKNVIMLAALGLLVSLVFLAITTSVVFSASLLIKLVLPVFLLFTVMAYVVWRRAGSAIVG